MIRAVASVPPPAPHGTISVIGRSGYAARATLAHNASNEPTTARTTACMVPPRFKDCLRRKAAPLLPRVRRGTRAVDVNSDRRDRSSARGRARPRSIAARHVLADERVELRVEGIHRRRVLLRGLARDRLRHARARMGPARARGNAPRRVLDLRAGPAVALPRARLAVAHAVPPRRLEASRRLAPRRRLVPDRGRAVEKVVVERQVRDAHAGVAPEDERAGARAVVERAGDAQLPFPGAQLVRS